MLRAVFAPDGLFYRRRVPLVLEYFTAAAQVEFPIIDEDQAPDLERIEFARGYPDLFPSLHPSFYPDRKAAAVGRVGCGSHGAPCLANGERERQGAIRRVVIERRQVCRGAAQPVPLAVK